MFSQRNWRDYAQDRHRSLQKFTYQRLKSSSTAQQHGECPAGRVRCAHGVSCAETTAHFLFFFSFPVGLANKSARPWGRTRCPLSCLSFTTPTREGGVQLQTPSHLLVSCRCLTNTVSWSQHVLAFTSLHINILFYLYPFCYPSAQTQSIFLIALLSGS